MKFVKWLNRRKVLVVATILIGGLAVFSYALYWQSLPQPAINFLDEIGRPKSTDRILVFSPHPDDETLAVGGYIYDAAKIGAKINIVLVTDRISKKIESERYQEFISALRVLGVNEKQTAMLNYPDGKMGEENKVDISNKFSNIITKFNPTIIIAPYPRDTHIDHKITGLVVEQLANSKKIQLYRYLVHFHFPQYPSPAKFLPEDYLLPPIRLINTNDKWEKYSLSIEAHDAKFEAMLQYKTQLRNPILHRLFYNSIRQNELLNQKS